MQLPTLPEVALRVREAVADPNISAGQVAEVLSQDAGLTARLIQVANSALYRGRAEIATLPMAIAGLGSNLVRDLVCAQVVKQMFQATNEEIDSQLRDTWTHSVEVAGVARGCAGLLTFEKSQALL